jgi:hypothetical protein
VDLLLIFWGRKKGIQSRLKKRNAKKQVMKNIRNGIVKESKQERSRRRDTDMKQWQKRKRFTARRDGTGYV